MYTYKGLRVYTQEEKTKYGLSVMPLPGTSDRLFLNDNTMQKEIFDLCARNYDAALPQSFFDAYHKANGECPRGVWNYDKNTISGEFLSLDAALFRLGMEITDAILSGAIRFESVD